MANYVGLRADDSGLWYWGTRWKMPAARRALLMPAGVRLVPDDPSVETLAWADYLPAPAAFLRRGTAANWSISPRLPRGSATSVHIGADPTAMDHNAGRTVNLVDPLWDSIVPGVQDGAVVLQALCQYISETPDAQAGLDDHDRGIALVQNLRALGLHRAPKHENRLYVGKRGDVRQALDKVVAEKVRLYRGRPIAGEPFPEAQEIITLTVNRLPSWIDRDEASPEVLQEMIADWYTRTPWPFGVLATGLPSTA